jgi:hypothetical protein
MIKEEIIYLSLYSKQVFDYSLRGYSHGRAGRAPDDISTCIKKAKKAKEDLDNIATPIGRESILIKVE